MWRLNRFKQIFQHPYTSCSTVKGGNNCVWRYTCWKQSSVHSGWEHSLWPMISPFCTTDSFRQGMMSSKSLGGGGGEGGGVDDGKAVCLVNKYHTQKRTVCPRRIPATRPWLDRSTFALPDIPGCRRGGKHSLHNYVPRVWQSTESVVMISVRNRYSPL